MAGRAWGCFDFFNRLVHFRPKPHGQPWGNLAVLRFEPLLYLVENRGDRKPSSESISKLALAQAAHFAGHYVLDAANGLENLF